MKSKTRLRVRLCTCSLLWLLALGIITSSCIDPGIPEEEVAVLDNLGTDNADSANTAGSAPVDDMMEFGNGGSEIAEPDPSSGGARANGGTSAGGTNAGGMGGIGDTSSGGTDIGSDNPEPANPSRSPDQIGVDDWTSEPHHQIYMDLDGDKVWNPESDLLQGFAFRTDQLYVRRCDGGSAVVLGAVRSDSLEWFETRNGFDWTFEDVANTRFFAPLGSPIAVAFIYEEKPTVFQDGLIFHDTDSNGEYEVGVDSVWDFDAVGNPVTGYFGRKVDGETVEDIGMFDAGVWRIDLDGDKVWTPPDEGEGDAEWKFGQPGDIPVVGDFQGDGTSEIGVYRGDGRWLIDADGDRQMSGGDVEWKFGETGHRPVVAPGGWFNPDCE